jgi:sugar lactone lactonase YvrE
MKLGAFMVSKLLLLVLVMFLVACADDDIHISGCEPVGDIRPVCGMQSPEDIAALDDGRHLLLAHFGGMHDATGSLSLFDTQTEQVTPLFPTTDSTADISAANWGDADCGPPLLDKFSPHGTHLHQLSDGRWRYLVVNHGGRETIEMFELLGQGSSSALAWRGCVQSAPETYMNDVVGMSNGDLIYTRMFHNGGTLERLLSFVGVNTGDLWRWNQATGLRMLPGTEANQPNGLEISDDERYVFANMYFTQELWKVDVDSGEVVATAPVPNADNSAWGSDGRLWVMTHNDSIANMLACFEQQNAACAAGFEVIAVDPQSMAAERVFAHRGPPMGAATVAVPQGGRVYMGSFIGDRLISVADFTR